MDTSPQHIRTYAGAAWVIGFLIYLGYAASTYSGLFEWACDWQDRVFGAHDSSVSFMGLLILAAAPVYALVPEFRRRPARPSLDVAIASAPDPVKQARLLAWLGGGCLLAGIVAGLVAFSAKHGAQTVVHVDLLQGAEPDNVRHADQIVIRGVQQKEQTAFLTTTTNGSRDTESFTPLTGKDWDERQPVQYVLREGRGESSRARASKELGEEVDPQAPPPRALMQVQRIGPAAIFRHALPGEVRADWKKRGLVLSPSLIVLDENLSRRNDTAWAISFCGILLGLTFLGLGVYMPRRLAAAAAKAS